MPESQSNTAAFVPNTSNVARRPLRRRPPSHSESLDPVSLARRRSLFRPASLLFFAAMAAFGLYASGHLPELDHFFDNAQAFGRAHNDVVVGTVLDVVPALLVLSAATVLVTCTFVTLRNRRSKPVPVAKPQPRPATALQAALVPVAPVIGDLAQEATPAAQVIPMPPAVAVGPEAPGKPISVEEKADIAEALQQPTEQKATVPTAQGTNPVPAESAEVGSHISESVPTLPALPRVRRRKERPTLSPAVIATLKMEVAKRTLSD